jgi:DNA-binding NarL/FixJ family response regulator
MEITMEGSDRIRILLVDDHPSYVEGLRMLLEGGTEDLEVVGTATDSNSALEMVGAQLPDLVLMDIKMPGGDGIEAAQKIREEFPVVKVAMLTISDEDEDVYEAMRAGASGYLPKQLDVDELVAAVRAIARGQVVVSPVVADRLLEGEPAPVRLTPGERKLLGLVAEGSDNASIASELNISESTLKRNLRNVIEKLHVENRVQAAVLASKKGWI